MRVVLDGTPLSLTSGGLPRYTRQLFDALVREFPLDSYQFATDVPIAGIPLVAGGGRGGRLWWSLRLPRSLIRNRIDVFHGTNFEVPYLPATPSVMTIHDLSPWRDPRWHVNAGRVRRRTPILLRLGLASFVITPSEAIRREAIQRFQLPPGRVVAIPEAAAPWFSPTEEPAERPFFLYAGAIEPRKNLTMLCEAWRAIVHDAGAELWIAGRPRSDAPRLPDIPGMRLLGEVSDAALRRLYAQAVAFVYPSLYEGFGLPVLEAMQCGAPVITSLDPALAETAGEAAIRLDAANPKEWAETMLALRRNPEARAARATASLDRARQFSWAETARRTREVYVEARRRRE